jgi:lipoprotein-anchoring transpeptidase ErfK/SrfK
MHGRGGVKLGRAASLLVVAGLVVTGCTGAPAAPQQAAPQAPGSSAPAKPATLALAPGPGAANIAPGEPVTVGVTDGKIGQVTLTGTDGKQVAGKPREDGSGWESTEALGYGKSYTLTANATGADGKPVNSTSTFNTAGKPARQIGVSLNAVDGETVGVGMPLIFTFTSRVPDRAAAERAIRIGTEPVTEGAFHWFGDNTVIWRPKDYWKPGTKVSVNAAIYGKNLGAGAFGQEDKPANITIGDKLVAVADGGSHQMKVSVNDQDVRTVPISMGKPGHNTPAGTYTVMNEQIGYIMDSSTYGVPADAPGGYRTWIQFAIRLSNSGIFYHSAPWSVGSQGKRNVSHGCINMSTANAKWMMDTSKKGDLFTVQNSGGKALEPTDGWSVWQMPWDAWITNNAN